MATKRKQSKKSTARKTSKAGKTSAELSGTSAKKTVEKSSIKKVKALKSHVVKVDYLLKAYKFSEARKKDTIHPRKIMPKVRKGAKVQDMTPTAALAFEAPVEARAMAFRRGAAPMAATDTITLVKNLQLSDVATEDTASHVCEPSAAMNGEVIFYTGNWFAAVSVDGGTTFKYVDPYATFPNPPGMIFCCDQVVHYVKSVDRFVWLLQYSQDGTGKNIQRIAYATTAKVKTGNWKYFDIYPTDVGLAAGTWLDFPDLSTGQNMLYMTSNNFSGNTWKASVVVRIKLSSFSTGVLSASAYRSTSYASFRVAQNCATTGFFVAHKSTSALRIFAWSESNASPTFRDVTVASWSGGPYSSVTPDGKNWLQRADGRHTGATKVGNEIWFAWGSAKGGANARPHAFVQIARINATTMALLENINMWDSKAAIFYSALSTNSNNEVGVSFAMGGPTKFPSHLVGFMTGTRRQVVAFTGNRGPSDNKWGDYLTVRRHYPLQKLFLATGYVLKTGAGLSDATPNFTIFCRSSDAP